jgi:GT2 family glycosyltransferase
MSQNSSQSKIKIKIGFVFTNYNNAEFTKEAVQSLYQISDDSHFYVVVVDNKSNIEDQEVLRSIEDSHTNVHVVMNDANLGYFKGMNVGIKYLRSRYKEIENIVIGNNDLLFPQGFFDSLHKILPLLKTHAVISPDVITLDKVHQNPHVIKSISQFREMIYDLYYSHYYLALFIDWVAKITKRFTDRRDEEQYQIAREIYQGFGCCYIMGPLFFENFEELWAPSFLMGEEFFLSMQLKEKNLSVYYEPAISVIHQCNGSVSKIPPKKIWEYARDAHKIYRRHVKVWK